MQSADWQTSSYCGEGNSCLGLAPASGRAVWFRESNDPGIVLTTTAARMGALLAMAKSDSLPFGSQPPAS